MMQLYVLKLLKMQTKYLGRQWRKTNMKIISAIYGKVRHHLGCDWAYGNDLDARPWDFQAEECTLRTCVDRFNNRRYYSQISSIRYPDIHNNNPNGAGNSNMNNNNNNQDNNGFNNSTVFGGFDGNDFNINNIINNYPYNGYATEDCELSEEFKSLYEVWLNNEVYGKQTNWDAILDDSDLII